MSDKTNSSNKQQGYEQSKGKIESERKKSQKIEEKVREEEKEWNPKT